MGRRAGSRNRDYEAERTRLALSLAPLLRARDGVATSVRELAAAADVSVPTLLHYFGSREGVWRATLEAMGALGAAHVARAGQEDHGPVQPSTLWLLTSFHEAWVRYGVGEMFGAGLALGMRSEVVGPTFVNTILEPTLQAAERRIEAHIAADEMLPVDVRAAGLALLSPLVLALLHQGALGGDQCRPLDIGALIAHHHEAWMRGWVCAPETSPESAANQTPPPCSPPSPGSRSS